MHHFSLATSISPLPPTCFAGSCSIALPALDTQCPFSSLINTIVQRNHLPSWSLPPMWSPALCTCPRNTRWVYIYSFHNLWKTRVVIFHITADMNSTWVPHMVSHTWNPWTLLFSLNSHVLPKNLYWAGTQSQSQAPSSQAETGFNRSPVQASFSTVSSPLGSL